MFEHSVKVPRHYKVAANIFKKVATEGGSVKNLLYDDKLKHFRTNVLYALITETIKHATDIDKIFENCGILAKEQRLDPWLAKILTAELLFGKKTLPGKSKPELTILSYKEQFENFRSENPDEVKSKVVHRPRYVRINTNLLTTSDAIRAFQDEGYKFIRCTSGSYDDYLKQIQGLTEYDFTQDYHVKTVFVFAPGTKFHDHELYLNNQIILQDKATALAVHLLAPPSGSTVLDMCAAPGMKTTQVAAYLRNQGKVYAVERNDQRYETLCQLVESTSSKCVETIHKDVLEIKRRDLDDVEYILLDPSCSGSGMDFSVHNYIEDTRLAKLTSLQEKFLKHAMNAFPNAKRIVYSTCSIFPVENERVVTNVVKTSRSKWRVQDVKELLKNQWNNFGSGMYGSMGTRCLYARPDSDMTTGFFLAVLDRDQKAHEDEGKSLNIDNNKDKSKTKDMSNCKADHEAQNASALDEVTDVIVKKKEKNQENENEIKNNSEIASELTNGDVETKIKKKHKKKKSKDDSNDQDVTEEVITEYQQDVTEVDHSERTENIETENKNKRKKNKTIEHNLGDDDNLKQNHEPDETGLNEPTKKKKKKNRDNEISTANYSSVLNSSDFKENNEKQKKRDGEESTPNYSSVLNSLDFTEDNVKEQKKKKKRDKEESTANNSSVLNSLDFTEDDVKEQKKKKKRDREESTANDSSVLNSLDITEDNVKEQKKKKKKKHLDE
ncbi:unnamed protein product [Danaus chrysippus]|uniref:(African queen) hypothetical protein n=1 Tax=Danaus chrysippus TaxID=151541 RepID=A0A8J2WFQ9_9NEOP|nr:unnamed protein product [Danaus chrysippus]